MATPAPLQLGKQPRQQQQTPEQVAAAAATSRKLLYGKPLAPYAERTIQVGQSTYRIPQPPLDWEGILRAGEQFQQENYHLSNWDKLSGPSRAMMGTLGGISRGPIVSFMTGLMDAPVVGPALRWLSQWATKAESVFGYAAQAQSDPDLRDPEVVKKLLFTVGHDYFDRIESDPNPKVRKAGQALLAGSFYYETHAEALPTWIFSEIDNVLLPIVFRPRLWFGAIASLGARTIDTLAEKGQTETTKFNLPFVRQEIDKFDQFLEEELGVKSLTDWYNELNDRWMRASEQAAAGDAMSTGGLPEMLHIREEIANVYRAKGTMTREDMAKIYADYSQRYGALAFEGQMSDIYGQLAVDPVNLVAFLKIKDWLHATRSIALLGRVAPEIANAAEDLRTASTALKAAGAAERSAVRLEQFTEAAEKFVKTARAMDLEDFTKAADEVETLLKAGAPAEDIAKAVDQVQPLLDKLDDMRQMGRTERIVLALTGGDPFHPGAGDIRVLGKKLWPGRLNPIALSAAARADDFLNTVYQSVSLILRSAGDDVEQMALSLKKAAAGAFGGRFGHMLISPIGRHVQAVLKGMDVHINDLLEFWHQTADKRVLANAIARAVGTDVVDIVDRAGKGAEESQAVFAKLTDAARVAETKDPVLLELFRRVNAGEITADAIAELGLTFKSTPNKIMPYTPELFRASLINRMSETIHDMAVAQFGLQKAGWFERAAVPVKAVESLFLLGLNPLYPIRNFYNNEVTMLLRGLSGTLMPSAITRRFPGVGKMLPTVEGVMESFGVNPARLHEQFGIEGPGFLKEIAEGTAEPEALGVFRGRELIRSTVWGKPGRVTSWIMEKVRNARDFRRVAGVMERMSSERAFATGFLRSWYQIRPKLYTRLEDFQPGLATRLDGFEDGLAELVDQAVRASRKPEDLQAVLTSRNIRMNLETVLHRVSREMGTDEAQVLRMLPPDAIETVRSMLEQLGPKPSLSKIEESFDFMRRTTQQLIDEFAASQIEDMAAEAVSKVETEGPAGLMDVWGRVVDRTTRRHFAHMERLDDAWERIYQIKDPVVRNRVVRSLLDEADATWERTWNYERAMRESMVRGMQKRGATLPPSFMGAYGDLHDASRTYIKLRNDLWRKFWETDYESFDDYVKASAEITQKLDDQYRLLTDTTDAAHARMDQAMIDTLYSGDATMKGVVQEWRDIVRSLRRGYMESVLEHRRSIRGFADAQKQAAWLAFHKENREVFTRIQAMEAYGRRALQGDQEAISFFRQNAAARGFDAESFEGMKRGVLSGFDLDAKEQANFEYWSSRAPMTPERRKLVETFGPFKDDVVASYYDTWDKAIDKQYPFVHEGLETKLPQNIHDAIYAWATQDAGWKDDLIAWIAEHPEDAQEIQQLAQWWLYEHGFVNVPLYGGNLRVYRGITGTPELSKIELQPFDSLTSRYSTAKKFAGNYPVLEFEIPTENILTHHHAHPGFQNFKGEGEFILNAEGYQGARLVSIDGRPPTEKEIELLRELNPNLEFGPSVTTPPKPMLDFDGIVGRQRFDANALDDMWFEEAGSTLDQMQHQVMQIAGQPAALLDDIPQDLRQDLIRFLEHSEGDLNDARLASMRMGEALRDSALLNYNRRYNFDNWIGVGMPFAFWWTHSMLEWSLSALQRPDILAAYAKTNRFLENVQGENRGFPSRLRGRVKIELPFAPKEFGDAWVDPFSLMGLPFQQFTRPFEQWKVATTTLDSRVRRRLEQMARDREASRTDIEEALRNGSGPTWDRARYLVLEDDSNLQFDLLDFMNLSVAPHIPISMLWNIARGRPGEIGVLPHTRTLRNVGALLGVDPGVYDNVWGNVRKTLGLPAYDQWEDYRVDRELGNMAGENKITAEDALRGMIDRDGQNFDDARRRTAKIEAAQWGYGLLGLPVNFYPPGEEHLREITPAFFSAMDQNEKGNPYPLRRFFENYPEYEARLALWRKPEERLKQFLADQIYNRYFQMPDINRREIREVLGDQFVETMLDKGTRNPDSVSVNVLAMWLRNLGGDAPGKLATDALPVPLTRPDIANRLQVWYDYVDTYFPHVYDIQQEYFKLDQGNARDEYKARYPVLPTYWKKRREFMYANPDLAAYLEDDPEKRPTYPSQAEFEAVSAAQPQFSWQQWEQLASPYVSRLVLDYYEGMALPVAAKQRLDMVAEDLGIEGGWQAVLDRMREAAPVLTGP